MPRIAMLLCDDLGSRIASVEGNYTELYAALLSSGDPTGEAIEMVTFRAHEDHLPTTSDLHAVDAVMISGSTAGVYESHQWLNPLFDTVRTAIDRQIPTIGVCFGHQVVARALGAEVAPYSGGWNLAGIDYTFDGISPPDSTPSSVRLIAFHRDQVSTVPAGTRRYLMTERCEIAGLVGDSVLTIQPHPEFSPAVAEAILSSGRGGRFSDTEVDEAHTRLSGGFDSVEVARWMRAFINRSPVID